MICVYPPDCRDFSGNGLGPLSPLSCAVTETLNGEWELTLTHPLDEAGKWNRLMEGCILRAPVPAGLTPALTMYHEGTPDTPGTPGREIWRVRITTAHANGYSRIYAKPSTDSKVLQKLRDGEEYEYLGKHNNSWHRALSAQGVSGYMYTGNSQYVRTEPGTPAKPGTPGYPASVIESRQLRDQPFRIYRVVPELDKITVYARHIFYDLMDNMIRAYVPASTTSGAAVVENLSAACLSPHDFTFYSDLTSTAENVIFENVNPVDALLGEGGVAEKYGAELARDWFDVFLVRRVGGDTNVQIRQGKNLLGVACDVDETNVVTRIMPTGEDKDGNVLYLPELYLDSPRLNEYPHVKWMHLPVSEASESDDAEEPKTREQCYAEMRRAAQAEFDAGCDLPAVTLSVNFINCADTEEYRQYGFLQNIFLGDAVRVIAPRIGVSVSMRMTQYTYDCLTRKYAAMTLGTVADTLEGSIISPRQLPSGIITGSKLAINSVGTGALQSGSVGSLQLQLAAVQTAHIQDAAVTRAKIAEAFVGELNVEALNAVTARIEELASKNLITDKLYAALAAIATAQITAANIENANISWADIGGLAAAIAQIATAQITAANIEKADIDWANIASLNARIAEIAAAQITAANIEKAHIDWASIEELTAAIAKIAAAQITTANIHDAHIDWAAIEEINAAIAELVNANIGTADIDWARIKDMATGTAIIEKGVNGKLYVADLAVTEANMVSLTLGELILKGADGCFYSVSVDEEGNVVTEKKQVDNDDVKDLSINAGEKIIAGTVTAACLNAKEIFADSAVIREMIAANLDVDTLFSRKATIQALNAADISGNESLKLSVRESVEKAVGYQVEVLSTSDVLSDAIRETTLTARVRKGSRDVTDEIDAGRFAWKRVSRDSTADELWNAAHRGVKSITLSTLDVYFSATYFCELTENE